MSITHDGVTPLAEQHTSPGTRHAAAEPRRRERLPTALRLALLTAGAACFGFPFWYMLVGSLQSDPDTDPSAALPRPGNLTFENYTDVDESLSLGRALVNSGIFTGGVLLATLVLGLLAGYALAVLHFRGRGALFAGVLLVIMVPFQLLMIPLYVLAVRTYGLSDTYLGMILPFAVNPTAVFVFRQFFLSVPRDLFEAARVDGASEFSILLRVAVPLCKPALLTAVLLTFIGPWNEFLWPFLITKQESHQPLAVALAGYVADSARGAADNPVGAILAGACVLVAPAIVLFVSFQRHFTSTNLGSGVKG